MADIQTNIPVRAKPLIVADAELFVAERTWTGGLPAPNILLETDPNESSSEIGRAHV